MTAVYDDSLTCLCRLRSNQLCLVPVVVAFGMTLPDGSTVAVGWSGGLAAGIALCRSTESASFIYAADVAWIGGSA